MESTDPSWRSGRTSRHLARERAARQRRCRWPWRRAAGRCARPRGLHRPRPHGRRLCPVDLCHVATVRGAAGADRLRDAAAVDARAAGQRRAPGDPRLDRVRTHRRLRRRRPRRSRRETMRHRAGPAATMPDRGDIGRLSPYSRVGGSNLGVSMLPELRLQVVQKQAEQLRKCGSLVRGQAGDQLGLRPRTRSTSRSTGAWPAGVSDTTTAREPSGAPSSPPRQPGAPASQRTSPLQLDRSSP